MTKSVILESTWTSAAKRIRDIQSPPPPTTMLFSLRLGSQPGSQHCSGGGGDAHGGGVRERLAHCQKTQITDSFGGACRVVRQKSCPDASPRLHVAARLHLCPHIGAGECTHGHPARRLAPLA